MSMLIFLIILCVLQATVSSFPPPPRNVKLISENFRHVLTWENNNLSASVRYQKITSSTGSGQWESVPKCSNVTTQRCEMTEYFTDLIGEYVGSVRSVDYNESSAFSYSPMFNPLEQTRLGPPIVHVTACNRCVNVSINPPISHIPSGDKNRTIPMLQDYVYPILEYTITVSTQNEYTRQLTEYAAKENFYFVVEDLLPNTNYCVSINASASNNLNEEKIPSTLQCVITEPHQLEGTGFYETLIGISVGAILLFLIGLLFFLIALDRAGYIFLGKLFLPKTLKSVPQSESRFYENKDVYSSAVVVPVAVIKKTEPKECESDDETSGPGYARRKNVLDSDQSSTSCANDCVLQYSASSSAVESSGQDSGSSADTGKSSELPLLIDIDESRSSNTNVVPAGLEIGPNRSVNMSDTFNINLNSVSVGDPENLWTGLCQEPSPKEPETGATLPGPVLVVLGSRDFPLFPNEVEAPGLSECEDCVSEEEVDSDDSQIDSTEQLVSDYMRRER